MGTRLNSLNPPPVTQLESTEERYPGVSCLNAKSFMSPTFWPILNTPMGQARRLALVRFLASRSCEKDRRLGSSPWGETQCGHSPTGKLNSSRPLPTRPGGDRDRERAVV